MTDPLVTPEIESLLSGRVVCIIDDSRAFTAGITELLAPYKCSVHVYNDANEGLSEVASKEPDVIITDYELGAVSGLDVIDALRKDKKIATVPILVLTGRDEPEVLISSMMRGAEAFVLKTMVRQVLIATLISLMRVRLLYKEVIRLKEFSAIKALIGTYKHEFGNILAILDGKSRKLERTHPVLTSDEAFLSIQKNIERMGETLKKLALLKDYVEEPYSKDAPIVKIN